MPKRSRVGTNIYKLETGDVVSRRQAARKLGNAGNTVAVPILCHALTDVDRHVRGDAAKALGNIGDVEAVEPLCALIAADTSLGAVRRAAKALGKLRSPKAVPTLLELIARNWSDLAEESHDSIIEIGLDAVPALCAAVGSERLQPQALKALIALHNGRSPSLFRRMTRNSVAPTLKAILAAPEILPTQRLAALEAIYYDRSLSAQLSGNRSRVVTDVIRLCDTVSCDSSTPELHDAAKELLNLLSLGRASSPLDTESAARLLRPASSSSTDDGGQTLMRAGTAPTHMPAASTSIWSRLLRGIRKRSNSEEIDEEEAD